MAKKLIFPPKMAMMKISASFLPWDGRHWFSVTDFLDILLVVLLQSQPEPLVTNRNRLRQCSDKLYYCLRHSNWKLIWCHFKTNK